MRRFNLWHPFLVSLYPVLYFYAQNTGYFSAEVMVWPGVLSVLAVGVMLIGFGWGLGSWYKGALMSTWAVGCFYLAGPLQIYLRGEYKKEHVLVLTVVPVVGLFLFLWRSRSGVFESLNKVMNVVGCVLIAGPVFTLVSGSVFGEESMDEEIKIGEVAEVRPDIYFIIMDAYTGSDALREFYDFDNSDFIGRMEEMGFYFPKNVYSNFPWTEMSVPSTMNMEFVQELRKEDGQGLLTKNYLHRVLKDNRLVRLLKSQDYEVVNIFSGFKPAENMRGVDVSYVGEDNQMEDYLELLVGDTALYGFTFHRHYLENWAKRLAEKLDFQFDGLREMAGKEGGRPRFIFCHVMSPHPPFFFDASGNLNPPSFRKDRNEGDGLLLGYTTEEYKVAYVAQVQALNQRLVDMLGDVVGGLKRPTVIIVQGDHGGRMYKDDQENGKRREVFSALNMVYGPKELQKQYYDGVTLVNTFRILGDYYFGWGMGLRPDRSYVCSLDKEPYELVDVTDDLR